MRHHRHWLKCLIVADLQRQILLAQRARRGPWVDTAGQRVPLSAVLADAECASEANHQHIRQRWSARSFIPANPRRGVPRGTLRRQMHRAFPRNKYAQRAKIETIFSVVKRKLSSRAPGRRLAHQIRQALLLGLTYSLYRLRHRILHRGSQQSHLKSFICHTSKTRGVFSIPVSAKASTLGAFVPAYRRQVSVANDSKGSPETI
jgi:hypothetical protein